MLYSALSSPPSSLLLHSGCVAVSALSFSCRESPWDYCLDSYSSFLLGRRALSPSMSSWFLSLVAEFSLLFYSQVSNSHRSFWSFQKLTFCFFLFLLAFCPSLSWHSSVDLQKLLCPSNRMFMPDAFSAHLVSLLFFLFSWSEIFLCLPSPLPHFILLLWIPHLHSKYLLNSKPARCWKEKIEI